MKNKKNIFNALFLFLVFGLTMYYVFHGEDMDALLGYLGQAKVSFWFVGVVLVVIFILSESVIIYYMMKSVGQPVILTHCFLYSFVGFFFSAITPSATGGQPAQLEPQVAVALLPAAVLLPEPFSPPSSAHRCPQP